MTPREQINNTTMPVRTSTALGAARAASTITLLAGIWFFISPWIYGVAAFPSAFNSWIVGGLVIIFAITRLSRPAYSTAMSWANLVLGIWILCSPWIYGYVANTGRFINSLCVGAVVIVFSLLSVRMATGRNNIRTSSGGQGVNTL